MQQQRREKFGAHSERESGGCFVPTSGQIQRERERRKKSEEAFRKNVKVEDERKVTS